MARVTHVKKAQQRYHTKPVLDENGEQKQVPVLRRDGSQKTTKGGRPVFLRLSERDLTRPKPLLKCGFCHEEIQLGTPYKWIEPHGQGQLTRHEGCPTWQQWEYSSSLSARIAQIQHGDPEGVESEEDIRQWLEEKAGEIRELAEEKRESASNMEEGFGHATSASDELTDVADQLESWADEVEQAEIPDYPEAEEVDCDTCGGSGHTDGEDEEGNEIDDAECEECGGSGQVQAEEPDAEAIDAWREEAIEAARSVLDESPV